MEAGEPRRPQACAGPGALGSGKKDGDPERDRVGSVHAGRPRLLQAGPPLPVATEAALQRPPWPPLWLAVRGSECARHCEQEAGAQAAPRPFGLVRAVTGSLTRSSWCRGGRLTLRGAGAWACRACRSQGSMEDQGPCARVGLGACVSGLLLTRCVALGKLLPLSGPLLSRP